MYWQVEILLTLSCALLFLCDKLNNSPLEASMESENCSLLMHPGDSFALKVNINLFLICTTNERSESRPYFTVNGAKLQYERSKVYNNTTIFMEIKSGEDSRYQCRNENSNDYNVKKFTVGDPPPEVWNFKCRSYDFEYLKCTFEADDSIPTQYTLSYKISSGSSYICHLTRRSFYYECNTGPYRNVYEQFTFKVTAKNCFGKHSQYFKLNQFNYVIPSKPKLRLKAITTNSVVLRWAIQKSLYDIKGLIYEIKLRSEYNGSWTHLDTSQIDRYKLKQTFSIHSLYANTQYEIKMRMKVTTAENLSDMWSHAKISFKTSEKKPEVSPEFDVGSFYIDNEQCVHIFWKTIPKYEMNGENFAYIVHAINKKDLFRDATLLSTTTHTIKSVDCQDGEYEFTIQSSNRLGLADSKSVMQVHVNGKPKINEYPGPERISIYYAQGMLQLKWTRPSEGRNLNLINYTVFRCKSKHPSFINCQDEINFTHLPANQTNLSFEIDKDEIQLALSANYKNGSSGMTMPICYATEETIIPPIKPKFNATSRSIQLEWQLNCEQWTILREYYLEYCRIDESNACIEPTNNITNIPLNRTDYTIEHLKPFTRYQLKMSINRSYGNERVAEALVVRTAEAAPSSPRNLKACAKSFDSIVLQWDPPEFSNGVITYYEVTYNNLNLKVSNTILANGSHIIYTLKNLRSYHSYRIQVKAVTTRNLEKLSGASSNEVKIRTNIGPPGEICFPNATTEDSKIFITWSRPTEITSPFRAAYEIELKYGETNERFVITDTSYSLDYPECVNYEKFIVSVRAINNVPFSHNYRPSRACTIDESTFDMINTNITRVLYGKWFLIYDSNCPSSFHRPIFPLIFPPVALLIAFLACSKLIYRKHQRMRDIHIKLPLGLQDIREDDSSTYEKKNMQDMYEILSKRTAEIAIESKQERYHQEFHDDGSIKENWTRITTRTSESEDSIESIGSLLNEYLDCRDNTELGTEILDEPLLLGISNGNGNVTINGYVQWQSLQNPSPQCNKEDESIKLNKSVASSALITQKVADFGINTNFSGYVTHQQMSILANRNLN